MFNLAFATALRRSIFKIRFSPAEIRAWDRGDSEVTERWSRVLAMRVAISHPQAIGYVPRCPTCTAARSFGCNCPEPEALGSMWLTKPCPICGRYCDCTTHGREANAHASN